VICCYVKDADFPVTRIYHCHCRYRLLHCLNVVSLSSITLLEGCVVIVYYTAERLCLIFYYTAERLCRYRLLHCRKVVSLSSITLPKGCVVIVYYTVERLCRFRLLHCRKVVSIPYRFAAVTGFDFN